MSLYVADKSFFYEFEGDKVEVVLSQMGREDFMKIAAIVAKGVRSTEDPSKIVMPPELEQESFDTLMEVVPKYTKDITGLRDANGNAIAKETVFAGSYFIKLVSKMSQDLMQLSKPSEEDEGNLEGQSQGVCSPQAS